MPNCCTMFSSTHGTIANAAAKRRAVNPKSSTQTESLLRPLRRNLHLKRFPGNMEKIQMAMTRQVEDLQNTAEEMAEKVDLSSYGWEPRAGWERRAELGEGKEMPEKADLSSGGWEPGAGRERGAELEKGEPASDRGEKPKEALRELESGPRPETQQNF